MARKVGIVIICISVLILVLGLSGNAFTYSGLKSAIEGVSTSSDQIVFDYAYLQVFGYSFKGFFSGVRNEFNILDFENNFDVDTGSYFFYVQTLPPEGEYSPYVVRVSLVTDDIEVARERYDKIIITFKPLMGVSGLDFTGNDFLDSILTVVQRIAQILTALYAAIVVIIQVLFDVVNVVFSLVSACFKVVGLA